MEMKIGNLLSQTKNTSLRGSYNSVYDHSLTFKNLRPNQKENRPPKSDQAHLRESKFTNALPVKAVQHLSFDLHNRVQKSLKNLSKAKPAIFNNENFNQTTPLQSKGYSQFAYDDDEEITLNVPNSNELYRDTKAKQNTLASLITLQMKLGKNPISIKDSNKKVPLMVSLSASECPNKEQRASTDIICVIDQSDSMEGEKLMLLKQTFAEILKYLEENDRLSIVTFSNDASRITPLMCMNDQNKKKTMKKVLQIQPNGMTNISAGIYHALEILRMRRHVNNVTSILLLTDGINTCGDAIEDIKRDLKTFEPQIKDTFSFHTFGYGSDHDAALMSEIARLKNGSFYFIDKLMKVKECFLDCISWLVSVIAQNVNICVSFNPDITVIKAFGHKDFWSFSTATNSYSAHIPQLISDKEINYIFLVQMPNASTLKSSFNLGQATCTLQGLQETNYEKCSLSAACIPKVKLQADNNSYDPNVIQHLFRVQTAEATNIARHLCEEKKYDEAKKVLIDMKSLISNSGVRISEMIVGLLKDLDDAVGNIKPDIFQSIGRTLLMENAYVHNHQSSNSNSNVCYSNTRQSTLKLSSQK